MHLRTADTLLLHTSERRTDVLERWSLCSFVKYCMNSVRLCFRSKEVTASAEVLPWKRGRFRPDLLFTVLFHL